MAQKDPYREFLEKDFGQLFDGMDLKENQRHYMRSRWLDQVLWMEGRASKARDQYYKLRLTSIIGGVIVPILVTFNSPENPQLNDVLKGVTIGLSAVVAVCAAVEEFFHYGERWRHYRRSVETLKTQGWQFSQLTGNYSTYRNHTDAFSVFCQQVEDIIQKDVELYATQVTQTDKNTDEERDAWGMPAYPPSPLPSMIPAPQLSSSVNVVSEAETDEEGRAIAPETASH